MNDPSGAVSAVKAPEVPFFRAEIRNAEIEEVVSVLRGGWLTSGPRSKRFEEDFAEAVGAKHAVSLNSCTAALHLAVEALGLRPGEGVLIPTMTFAATAEVIRYQGAIPILVDTLAETGHLSLKDAAEKIDAAARGTLAPAVPAGTKTVGVIAVHVGGLMLDIVAARDFARKRGLWLVEDAAHSFPSAMRAHSAERWMRCGEDTADVTCFSFYANKTITTGEGGMAVTADSALASRMRLMSLHGLSRDAWNRYSGGTWDYRIVAPGYKYNLTDIAAAIGIHQLQRAEDMRLGRQSVAEEYLQSFTDVPELELPLTDANRIHSWHLFPIRLVLDRLTVDRDAFVEALREEGIGCSVHWRPLHLHPYYADALGWRARDCPLATQTWVRLISLPIFAGMTPGEVSRVVDTVRALCSRFRR